MSVHPYLLGLAAAIFTFAFYEIWRERCLNKKRRHSPTTFTSNGIIQAMLIAKSKIQGRGK